VLNPIPIKPRLVNCDRDNPDTNVLLRMLNFSKRGLLVVMALVDGDIVCYRAACSAENDEQWVAQTRADKIIQEILENTQAESYKVFLTGSSNFRREIAPTYKANRPDERPAHWQAVREFLVTQHKAIVCEGCEADDYLGMEQGPGTIICSIDKDLLQVPGRHYNFVKKEFNDITPTEGLRRLYIQSLVGDRSDNIEGVVGIGPVKAERHLSGLFDPRDLYEACRSLYNDDKRFHLNMKLLYVWRKPEDSWEPPKEGAT
jgi:5'-3' exonuclease